MNEKKEALLEQLERMKEGATNSLANGGEYYIMHAECAVKFATEAIELLMDVSPQEAPTKPGFTLRRLDENGQLIVKTVETECISVMYVGEEDSTCINSLNGTLDDVFDLISIHNENIKRLGKLLDDKLKGILEKAPFLQGGDGDEKK